MASWVRNDAWLDHQHLELETDLIAAHILAARRVPPAQFVGEVIRTKSVDHGAFDLCVNDGGDGRASNGIVAPERLSAPSPAVLAVSQPVFNTRTTAGML
jgi:hypothetical protein